MSHAQRIFSKSSFVTGSVGRACPMGGLMPFAGFACIHWLSTQNRKNVRSRSSFFPAEIGDNFHVSRYLRTSSTVSDATSRPLNSSESSSVSNRYFPSEALERFLASQSLVNATHACGTVLCSALFECADSQSLTNF